MSSIEILNKKVTKSEATFVLLKKIKNCDKSAIFCSFYEKTACVQEASSMPAAPKVCSHSNDIQRKLATNDND